MKSYFYGDERKKVEDLLAETVSVDGVACGSELESLVLEARLIREHEPKYNRRGKTWRKYAYLRIDDAEAYPRIKVVRETKGGGAFLGPFPSSHLARLAKEALEDVFPIRRCTKAMRASTRFAPCALAEMHRCLAPCDGRVGPERYEELVRSLISSLSTPGGLLGTLEARMRDLAGQERFEEAVLARDRLRALAEALARARIDGWLLGTGELVLRDADGHRLVLRRGGLIRSAGRSAAGRPVPARSGGRARRPACMGGSQRGPRRDRRRVVLRTGGRRRRAASAAPDAPSTRSLGRTTVGRRLD